MQIATHEKIDLSLCGEPVLVEENQAHVQMKCDQRMAADAMGLVHGGFIFGLADYAAMLSVNHPHVVLGAAETRFLKPSRVGDVLLAKAQDTTPQDRKHLVQVEVFCNEEAVFSGTFTCFIPKKHVLENG